MGLLLLHLRLPRRRAHELPALTLALALGLALGQAAVERHVVAQVRLLQALRLVCFLQINAVLYWVFHLHKSQQEAVAAAKAAVVASQANQVRCRLAAAPVS